MKPGSVIVDMAVEQGGNCPLSEFGKVVEKHGVKIVGPANLPAELADRRLRAVRAQPAELHHAAGRQGDQGAEDRPQRRDREGHAGDPGRPDRASAASALEALRARIADLRKPALDGRQTRRRSRQARDPGAGSRRPASRAWRSRSLDMAAQGTLAMPDGHMPFVALLTIFALACFVGYYVVWRVTPALHSPLMAVTNAVSSVIIVGALLAAGLKGLGAAQLFGVHRRRAGRGQHLRRLHRHAPHAVDVQEEDAGQEVGGETTGDHPGTRRLRLPDRGHLLHHGAARAVARP